MNAFDYGIAQDRKRVIIVGLRSDIAFDFIFPGGNDRHLCLKDVIGDLPYEPCQKTLGAIDYSKSNIANHDVYIGGFDSKYMSRNRVRTWEEPSFTIQAQAKNEPMHPNTPRMEYVSENVRRFRAGNTYRRLTIRECARIQSFPDDFIFEYTNILDGYKMVGNAVPPLLAEKLARAFAQQMGLVRNTILFGYYKDLNQLNKTIENKLYYIRYTSQNMYHVAYLQLLQHL